MNLHQLIASLDEKREKVAGKILGVSGITPNECLEWLDGLEEAYETLKKAAMAGSRLGEAVEEWVRPIGSPKPIADMELFEAFKTYRNTIN